MSGVDGGVVVVPGDKERSSLHDGPGELGTSLESTNRERGNPSSPRAMPVLSKLQVI